MKTLYQPYPPDTAHSVSVSRIGNRPTTLATSTPTHRRTPLTPLVIDADQRTRSTARIWAHRAWITVKALAYLTAAATIAALVALLVFAVITIVTLIVAAVTWVISHLVAIVVLGGLLLLLCGGAATCTGIHCGGCRG